MDKNKIYIFEGLTLVTQIGLSMITPIVLCIIAGNYLDKKIGTSNVFLLLFIIIGVGSGFISVYKIFTRDYKK